MIKANKRDNILEKFVKKQACVRRIVVGYRRESMEENNIIDPNKTNKEYIINRLKRIEGQVKGIQKMIEEDKYCVDILTQIAAVRAAVNKVGGIVLQEHTRTCLHKAEADKRDEVMNDLINTVQKFLKFID